MKKHVYGWFTAVALSLMTVVTAQDYCCQPRDAFDGFYIAGNVGGLNHIAHRNDLDGALGVASGWTTSRSGWEAGIGLGYDWQCRNTVFGLVADWNWTNATHNVPNDPNDPGVGGISGRNHWFTTIRARAGLAVNDALVYITGGAVVTRIDNSWANAAGSFSVNDTRWGWVVGTGAEFKLDCDWSIGAEVLYLSYGSDRNSGTIGGVLFNVDHSDEAVVGRLTLNYRFAL